MAENQQQNPTTSNTFTEGMITDPIDLYKKNSTYSHARNAVKNLPDGQLGAISTEPANIHCCDLPYTLIGSIPLTDDQWMVFTTNNIVSEIGIFYESQCRYQTLTGPQTCPNFSTEHLIIGASRRGFDCGFDVYWSDGKYNPDRFINTVNIPWVQTCTTTSGCVICTNTSVLDCEKLRIAPHFIVPCLTLSKSQGSGQLLNGSYQVAIRYAINSIACTDFIALSNIQSIFSHNNVAGAVKLAISGAETTTFQEMEVVLISEINSQVEARSLGIYSTSQSTIYIDDVDQELTIIPLSILPLNTPAIESSDAIYSVAGYLTRVGVKTRPEFNYQPLANKIVTKWVCVEYPDDYYHKGGNEHGMNVGFMRGEVYAYYVRWVYTTGDKTTSYHIPGSPGGTPATFAFGGPPAPPGSIGTIASGLMEGYSSTEIYPDRSPLVWDLLCGQPIMHHKYPDQTLHPDLTHFTNNFTIRVMGVFFENIQLPVDINGVVIPDIQGYEILRAVREGHKSVIAKGMINNMRTYTDSGGQQGLFQNYPYNDLRPDYYLTSNVADIDKGTTGNGKTGTPLTGYRTDILSFHSPDTVFQNPILGAGSLKIVMGMSGNTHGQFQVPYKHPMFKVLTDFDSWLGNIIGGIELAISVIGAVAALTGGSPISITLSASADLPINIPLYFDNSYTNDVAATDVSSAVKFASAAANFAIAVLFAPIQAEVVRQQFLNLIKGLIPGRQYAAQYNSSGFYNNPIYANIGSYGVTDYSYIKGQVQSFRNLTVNNIYRNNYVALQLDRQAPPLFGDNSRYLLSDVGSSFNWDSSHTVASYYASYNVPQAAQYGQVDSGKQVPISCVQQVDTSLFRPVYTSPILFGGDTYINRYTEKNPMFFFNDWLRDVPEDFKYDYRNYINVPYPMFWLNNDGIYHGLLAEAHQNRRLDGSLNAKLFYVTKGYFYLFNNGVRDFYVESEVNVGYRDWEDTIPKMFYDPYGFQDINQMFRSDIIKSDTLYKYDYSLSVSRFFNQYLSWGKTLGRDYDPLLAYTCFSYYPRRVHYSLPQEEEGIKDNWRIYLPNNYKDFPTTITAIKEIHKSGALILLKDQAPQQFQGVDNLVTGNGVKVTVGDGGLFQQPLQSVSNADNAYEYGSCQNRLSIVNTPHGVYYVSQTTGKIFCYGGEGLQDITPGLKWHLAKYLPSTLLQQFPNYVLYDNPVAGSGIQTIYDAINEALYICKKECTLKDEYQGIVLYDPAYGFYTTDGTYHCAPGYTLSGTTCTRTIGAIATGTGSIVGPITPISVYGSRGPALFNSGYTLGGIGTFSILGAAFWRTKVNTIAVWDTVHNPIDTYVGFKECITVASTKTYYIALCMDDTAIIKVDGVAVFDLNGPGPRTLFTSQFTSLSFTCSECAVFELMGIYPVTLTAGVHVLEVLGSNSLGPGMIAMEIYDNTALQISTVTSNSDLNIIFTTQGQTAFNAISYTCPPGYTTTPGASPCDIPGCGNIAPAILNRNPIAPCDPVYFTDVSWTLSYDCREKQWISWHDWHPTLNIPSKTHFLTTQGSELWRHNQTTGLWTNYYGVQYPFEVMFTANMGTNVSVLQNVEYAIDSYLYRPNSTDKFTQFDGGFDRAIIFNEEQCSGWLELNLKPPDNPYTALQYPFVDAVGTQILYSQVERHWRFNTFFDLTNDRGEYDLANVNMINTDGNGYTFTLNNLYFDMFKPWNQKKRFRSRNTKIFLRKNNPGYNSLSLLFTKTNNQNSPR